MSRTLSAGLTTLLQGDTVKGLACALVITRKDETVIRLAETLADRVIAGNVFHPVVGLKRGSIPWVMNEGPQSVDLEFAAYTGGTIAINDVRDGLYKNATCSIYAFNREDANSALDLLFFGDVGDIKYTDLGFVEMTVVDVLGRLRQTISDVYQGACRVDFTSAKCGISAASVTFPATIVTAVGRFWTVTGLSNPSGTFNLGLGTLTSGRIKNWKNEIRTSTLSGGTTTLEFYRPWFVNPTAGDTANIRQGCSHDLDEATGCPFYNNIDRYRGEPYQDADGAFVIQTDARSIDSGNA